MAKARSTAEVLLTHPENGNDHGPHVLLATMYHPQGRTAYLGTDETFRWRFRYLETYREPFWRGLVRHLALNRLRRSDFRPALPGWRHHNDRFRLPATYLRAPDKLR